MPSETASTFRSDALGASPPRRVGRRGLGLGLGPARAGRPAPARALGPVLAALLAALGPAGCLSEEGAPAPEGGAGAGGAAPAGGEPRAYDFCPRPDEPRVHYQSRDPNACAGVALACAADQNGFQNSCGCGCIDKGAALCPAPFDPAIAWQSTDPANCPPAPPACPLDQYGFSDACGCGCMTPGP